jgi:hypothetical protein
MAPGAGGMVVVVVVVWAMTKLLPATVSNSKTVANNFELVFMGRFSEWDDE